MQILLWPLYRAKTGIVTDVFGRAQEWFSVYLAALASPIGLLYVGLSVLLLGGSLALWIADGTPGLVECRLVAGRIIRR